MKGVFSVYIFTLLLALVSPSQGQQDSFSLLSSCAQQCLDGSSRTSTCDPFTDRSCVCSDVTSLADAKSCYTTSCSRKEALSALNVTAIACDEPFRDKSRTYRVLDIAFFSLALTAIVSRWTAHATVGRVSNLDEANMFVVLVLDVTLFAVAYKMSHTGLGQDMWRVPSSQITTTLLYFWISEIVYFTLLGFIKISFLLFFLQIFPEKRFRTLVWGIIFFQLASMTAFGIAATFVCSPVSFSWTQWDGEHTGKCINNNSLAFSHAAHSILIDFITLSLPFTQIWRLHLAMKKKIGVLLMFSVGAFVTVVSILRLRSLVHFANTTNMTWDYLEASLWSIIECQVGIICACMPSIRLGLARLFPKILGSTRGSGSKQYEVKSGGHDESGLNANSIAVHTSFRISHARKPQTNDEGSFVQLVEIDRDTKSADDVLS